MDIETPSWSTTMNLVVIAIGVMIASYGELQFNWTGFMLQIGAIFAEATRLALIQILLTSKDIKLNSVTTLYYVSPACFVFLCVPFFFMEFPKMMSAGDIHMNPAVLISNAAVAFALNVAVYLLIGKTSALTMNVAGVVKDWILIFISSLIFDAPISSLQIGGYLLSLAAVCHYNYAKYQEKQLKMAQPKPDTKEGAMPIGKSEGNSK